MLGKKSSIDRKHLFSLSVLRNDRFYDTTMNQTMDWRTKNFIQTIMLQLLTMPYVQKSVTKVSITHLW